MICGGFYDVPLGTFQCGLIVLQDFLGRNAYATLLVPSCPTRTSASLSREGDI